VAAEARVDRNVSAPVSGHSRLPFEIDGPGGGRIAAGIDPQACMNGRCPASNLPSRLATRAASAPAISSRVQTPAAEPKWWPGCARAAVWVAARGMCRPLAAPAAAHRRHLTNAQKAEIALRALPHWPSADHDWRDWRKRIYAPVAAEVQLDGSRTYPQAPRRTPPPSLRLPRLGCAHPSKARRAVSPLVVLIPVKRLPPHRPSGLSKVSQTMRSCVVKRSLLRG
jgi:hypothetical protein